MTARAIRAARVLALLAGLACIAACAPVDGGPPNVVLVVLDTARADRFSAYGYDRETTPAFAELASESLLFERAYATSSWTLASHASLFTGLLPVTHRATQENLHLDAELETLAELLSGAGYRTAAFSNNSWVSQITNLVQGFEKTFPLWRDGVADDVADDAHPTNVAALDWLDTVGERPFFAFVNYIEPHWPYRAPRRHQDRFVSEGVGERMRARSSFPAMRWYTQPGPFPAPLLRVRDDMYDAELRHVDGILGALVAGLRGRDLLDDTLLVVTADHGENLGKNGHQGHSFTLFDATLRIPLLVRPPGGVAGAVRPDPVQLTDVFATIAAAAGVAPADPRVLGADLLAGPVDADRPIVGEYYFPKQFLSRFPPAQQTGAALAPYRRRIRSIQVGDHKLIWGSDGRHALYDVAADPGESRDRIGDDPERARRLEAQLLALVKKLERESIHTLSPEELRDEQTLENLRALGYVR